MDSMFLIKLIYFSVIFHCHQSSPLHLNQEFDDFVDYTGYQVIRVVPENDEQYEYLKSLEIDDRVRLWLRPTKIGAPVDIMVPPLELEKLNEDLDYLEFSKETLIPDVGESNNKPIKFIQPSIAIKKKIRHMEKDEVQFFSSDGKEHPLFNAFQRYETIQKYLVEIHEKNPNITELSKLGKSVEGRDIDCIKIGSNLGSDKKEIIYIDGGMHAREWAAVSTALYLIDHLIEDFNKGDELIIKLLEKYDFFIVPVVNPDGYEFTHTKDRMWRKNRGKTPGSNCIGVDLNRNYPFHWGGEGSSNNPCSQLFAGTKALSEPESKALTEFILSHKNKMKVYITLHAYGQYFLYPWGWTKDESPNDKELKRVADIGYKALYAVHQTKYQVGPPSKVLYVSQGSDDWAHGEALIPFVYCLEMRDSGKNGFLLPRSEIIPVGEEVYAAVKAMAQTLIDIMRIPGTNVISGSTKKTVEKRPKVIVKKELTFKTIQNFKKIG